MELMEAILTRRSIRSYRPGAPVSAADVDAILRAAMNAPTAGDARPWHFVVIRDPATLAALAPDHLNGPMLREAAAAVLVCGDVRLEKFKDFWIQDCCAATQNLLLAAHARGLGAVWLAAYPLADRVAHLRALLDLPEPVIPLALVTLGRPAEQKESVDRSDPARVHSERFGQTQGRGPDANPAPKGAA